MISWKKVGRVLLIVLIIMLLLAALEIFFFSVHETLTDGIQQTHIVPMD
ncbi:MAG: hypothetical protein PUC12_04490 [Clostridiales bacterium]|nr:hypothetical protein [Clostridiales bacterium]